MEYVEFNRQTYETLADEYQQRWKKFIDHQTEVLRPFTEELVKKFGPNASALDVGCGVGLDSYILSKCRLDVSGIDISSKMISHAKINVPTGKFTVANFVDAKIDQIFDGVVMNAFIHLFPKTDCPEILKKAKAIMREGGIGFISTTKSDESKEGYVEKDDYSGHMKRYRKHWTKKELEEAIVSAGFTIIDTYENNDPVVSGKVWMNVMFHS